jgi:hypothetical protein
VAAIGYHPRGSALLLTEGAPMLASVAVGVWLVGDMTQDIHSGTRSGGVAGLLAALAALVTAIGGAFVAVHGGLPGPSKGADPPVVILSTPGGAAPSEAPETQASLRFDNAPADQSWSTELGGADQADQLIDDCAAGDMQACTTILDILAQECGDGDGLSCDVLFEISPVGSDYEEYGATCGARFDWEYADGCSDL